MTSLVPCQCWATASGVGPRSGTSLPEAGGPLNGPGGASPPPRGLSPSAVVLTHSASSLRGTRANSQRRCRSPGRRPAAAAPAWPTLLGLHGVQAFREPGVRAIDSPGRRPQSAGRGLVRQRHLGPRLAARRGCRGSGPMGRRGSGCGRGSGRDAAPGQRIQDAASGERTLDHAGCGMHLAGLGGARAGCRSSGRVGLDQSVLGSGCRRAQVLGMAGWASPLQVGRSRPGSQPSCASSGHWTR